MATAWHGLQRLLKKPFWTFEEGKLKLTPHGQSTTYGPSWGKLQLAQGLFQQPL
jgi:hypothetical protein